MTDTMTCCSTSRRFSRPARTLASAAAMPCDTRPAVQMFWLRLTLALAPSLSTVPPAVVLVAGRVPTASATPSPLVSIGKVRAGAVVVTRSARVRL
ncbi:hypothetical protein D3C77_307230 [compost metagenome]